MSLLHKAKEQAQDLVDKARHAAGRLTGDRHTGSQHGHTADRPSAGGRTPDRPTTDRRMPDTRTTDRPTADRLMPDSRTPDRPAANHTPPGHITAAEDSLREN